ncbi:MAG: ester cyclase [Actinomycetota bacterium]
MSREDLERLDDQGMSAWDNHDAESFASLFADDFVLNDWTLPEPIRDKEGVRQYVNAWMTAFPDMNVKQTNRVVGEDAVAAEVEFTGTNSGTMVMAGNEVPPTNKVVNGRGSYIARVRDGKIVEFNAHPDVAGMMMQLGFMPQL